jgi:DNA-binding NarL/FixJ family response regulator/anti-sigma regulatory factor (Ser/Thr protein kinase)
MTSGPQLHLQLVLRKTVIVVGDNPDIPAQVSAILPSWSIERAANNFDALKLVEARHFDLVLTDESTSGKSDVELLCKIRRVRAHIRMIILTSESTPIDVIAAMREHAFSYFSTPFSPSAFAEIIRLATEGPCWDDGIEVLSATPSWLRLAARCDRRTADRLLQFFHEIVDLPEDEKHDVASAFREMLLNAIEHGARFDPSQYVEISYIRGRHVVMCRVKDPGEGFSLDEIQHAACANPPDDPIRHQIYRDARGLRPGGFGVLLTQHLVDELIYGEKGNEVLLIKYLDDSQRSGSDAPQTGPSLPSDHCHS